MSAVSVVASAGGTLNPTVGALLLFGRADALLRQVPTHEAAFQVLRGTSVEMNDFCRWPLFRVAEELLARFQVRNTEQEPQLGLIRLGVPLVPEVARSRWSWPTFDAHGRITRSQAADLCRLTPRQASALLRRLTDRGDLVIRGVRRGAHYARG